MKKDTGFLGRGWAFPPGFSSNTRSALLVDEEEDIRQSLTILLSTRLGERVMQPKFGCDLQFMMFEKIDKPTSTFIRDMVETAILYHEPRIKLIDVRLHSETEDEGKIDLEIVYMIRSTNTRSNMVYPFYLQEASNLAHNP